jgi:hypothetical protein
VEERSVADTVVEALTLDLLEWLAKRDRSYEEVMDAWRTSCPRLPVWEDANDRGLVTTEEVKGRCIVRITSLGLALLEQDVRRGETLYRVFLLRNTLQVDLSFWPADRFRATGPKFRLIFGSANEPQGAASDSTAELIGLAWLYGLHVRSSIARRRLLQAEYMLSNMRNRVIALSCLREGLSTSEGRGFDDLPSDLRSRFAECYPSSLHPEELECAFQQTMRALLNEIRLRDGDLAEKVGPTLIEIAGCDVSPRSAAGES